jgi:putative heme-binding domain-containing protein
MSDDSLNVRKLSRRLLDAKSQEEVHKEVQARLSRNMNLLREQKVSPNDISDLNWKYAGIMLKNPKVLQYSVTQKENIKSDLRVVNDQAETAALRGLRNSLAAYENVTGDTSLTKNFDPAAIYIRKLSDYHPQFILESLHLLRIIKRYQTVDFALATLDQPLDDFLDYALWLTIRETQPQWLPELNSGKLEFVNDPKKVMYVLKATENPALIAPLIKLLNEKKVAADQVVLVLELIGKYGQKEHLQLLWDQALADTDSRAAIIKILYDTAKVRKIKPDNFTDRVSELTAVPYALPLAGLWKVNAVKPMAVKLALDQQTPEASRIQAMMALETYQDKETLVVIATNKSTSTGFRRLALNSLINLDPKGGITLAATFLAELKPAEKAEFNALFDVILSKQQGPQVLTDALKNVNLNAELVNEALRKTSSIGKRGETLIAALRKAGSIIQGITKLTPEQTQALMKKVAEVGNAERGEIIYRRQELNCQKCHQLAGAGGQVGPDMLSLGASSPVDYIIQSLIEPSAKIKEGYHTTQIRTLDGIALLGLLVRETNDEVVIRNSENKEISVPKADIVEKKNSTTSLMPAELTAKLSEDEFIDLVAFLSNLGKDGPYKAPAKRYVRRWILEDKSELYSQVSGMLPMNEAAEHTVTIEIKVTAPGNIGLKLSDLQLKRVTRGTETDNLRAETIIADLPVGIHQFHFGIPKRTEPFSIEVLDLPNSAGVAEPVNK